MLDPDEVEQLVTAELGASALFASRFRECAARALLLPRRQPGRRTPLWQQRQRSAQLLSVASQYGTFPIVLETVRECLQDVFDVPGLTALMRDLAARRIRLVEVETAHPSPFARSLLFRYVGAFMYEGDAPLAERRAQALALDSSLLAELLGQADAARAARPGRSSRTPSGICSGCRPAGACRDAEEVADMLRARRAAVGGRGRGALRRPGGRAGLAGRAGRPAPDLIEVRVAGEQRWAAIEDAGRLRDALGVALPTGVPDAFTEPVPDPLGDLVARYARGARPVHRGGGGHRYGLGIAVVTGTLQPAGRRGPGGRGRVPARRARHRVVRRRRAAAAAPPLPGQAAQGGRAGAARRPWPVPARLAERGSAGRAATAGRAAGPGSRPAGPGRRVRRGRAAGRARPCPPRRWRRWSCPAGCPATRPALLDELTAAGEVVWSGAGALPGGDGWLVLAPGRRRRRCCCRAPGEITMTPVHEAVLAALDGGGGAVLPGLADRVTRSSRGRVPARRCRGPGRSARDRPGAWPRRSGIWSGPGRLTNDTLAPLRTVLGHRQGRGRDRARHSRRGRPGTAVAADSAPADQRQRPAAGRCRAAPGAAGRARCSGRAGADRLPAGRRLRPRGRCRPGAGPPDGQRPLVAAAARPSPTRPGGCTPWRSTLLDRHGILIRGAAMPRSG